MGTGRALLRALLESVHWQQVCLQLGEAGEDISVFSVCCLLQEIFCSTALHQVLTSNLLLPSLSLRFGFVCCSLLAGSAAACAASPEMPQPQLPLPFGSGKVLRGFLLQRLEG